MRRTYKVGDRVKITNALPDSWIAGDEGTVIEVVDDLLLYVEIAGKPRSNALTGRTGWCVLPAEVEPVEELT